jgi:hypothetical protein
MSAPAGQAARRLAPAGAAALAGLAAGDRTEALRDRPTESEEVPLAGSWLEIGLKPGDVDVDGGLEILAPAAVETIPTEAVASEAARRAIRLGADLARDPAVQRAVAARIGGVPQLEDVSREGETEALRAVVEALASERDDLLRERLETQREALGLDVEGISLPSTPPDASEGSVDSIEEMFWGPQRRRDRAPEETGNDENSDKDPEEDDFTFTEQALGAALAVASLVLVVSVARAAKPFLARRAAYVAAAAIAGVVVGL